MGKRNKLKEVSLNNKDLFEMGFALIQKSGESVVLAHKKNDGSGVGILAANTTGLNLRELLVGILADIFRISEKLSDTDKNIEEVSKLVFDALNESKKEPIN